MHSVDLHLTVTFFWNVKMRVRSALFWNFTQYRMVVPYRRFGTAYHTHLRASSSPRKNSWTGPLKMEPIDCPETSVWNYYFSLPKIPKVLRPHLYRGGRQKSRIIPCVLAGAIRVDNCPRKFRRSNRRGR